MIRGKGRSFWKGICLGLLLVCPWQGIFADLVYEPRPAGEWESVSKKALESFGRELAGKNGPGWRGLPYRNWVIDPEGLIAGNLMSAVKPVAWSYLFFQGETFLGSVGLDASLESVIGFQADVGVTADFWKAIQFAENQKVVKEHRYFVRYLGASSILFAALWLHSDSDDLIIPIGNTFGRWTAFQIYSPGEIEGLLKSAMTRQRKINDGMSRLEQSRPPTGH